MKKLNQSEMQVLNAGYCSAIIDGHCINPGCLLVAVYSTAQGVVNPLISPTGIQLSDIYCLA